MSEHTHQHDLGHQEHADASHDHAHHHKHDNGAHVHEPRAGIVGLLLDAVAHLFGLHQHDHTRAFDSVLESSARGIWALQVSLLALLATAIFQVVIVAMSGSVALLADTIHNFSDALTAIPLWIAFALNRRAPNRRYTYGYGRAEDLAGVVIVLMIFGSALVVFYESIQKILHPQPLANLGWVALAAVIGFLGNEAVAVFRLRVGREIGSAALIADGLHARVDGITSLGVLFGVIGVWLGLPWADPVMGFIIGFAILIIVRDAAREMWRRLMDATDPEIVHRIEHTTSHVEGVQHIHAVRARWVGHRLHTEIHIEVDCDLTVAQSHAIAEEVRHALFHELPALNNAIVHLDPCEHDNHDHHAITAHHSSN
ncbi:MAG: cation transporter [Chloroflexi bacterium]|nr:cation transporter [Chloroflexota bacterium]